MSEILQLLQIYVLRVSNKHYKAFFKSGGCQHDWFILLPIFDELSKYVVGYECSVTKYDCVLCSYFCCREYLDKWTHCDFFFDWFLILYLARN